MVMLTIFQTVKRPTGGYIPAKTYSYIALVGFAIVSIVFWIRESITILRLRFIRYIARRPFPQTAKIHASTMYRYNG